MVPDAYDCPHIKLAKLQFVCWSLPAWVNNNVGGPIGSYRGCLVTRRSSPRHNTPTSLQCHHRSTAQKTKEQRVVCGGQIAHHNLWHGWLWRGGLWPAAKHPHSIMSSPSIYPCFSTVYLWWMQQVIIKNFQYLSLINWFFHILVQYTKSLKHNVNAQVYNLVGSQNNWKAEMDCLFHLLHNISC
jgi:hypothetical protein